MQTGWVERHGRGWRGGWREHGTKRYTAHVAKKGDARALLNDELRRIEQGSQVSSRRPWYRGTFASEPSRGSGIHADAGGSWGLGRGCHRRMVAHTCGLRHAVSRRVGSERPTILRA
jgi:hypothetical protein